jgi:hypothetical protein
MPTVEAVAGLALLDNRRAQAAYDELAPQIRAIHPDDVRSARADLNVVCARAFAMLPRLREMRPDAVEHFKQFDLAQFDSIEQRVLATYFANLMWLSATRDRIDVAAQAEVLTTWRTKLLAASEVLATFGLVSAEPLKKVGTDNSYAGLVNDVSTLLGVLHRAGDAAKGKTPLTDTDLAIAEREVLEMQTALGTREIAAVKREEAATQRLQAFTFLLTAFDAAYRAAYYLYGEERAREILPSLFPDHVAKRRKGEEEVDETVSATATGPAAAGTGVGAAGGAPLTPSATNPGGPAFVLNNPTGLPLGNPLEH